MEDYYSIPRQRNLFKSVEQQIQSQIQQSRNNTNLNLEFYEIQNVEYLRKLPELVNLQKLGIFLNWKILGKGMELVSHLKNLKRLNLRTYTIQKIFHLFVDDKQQIDQMQSTGKLLTKLVCLQKLQITSCRPPLQIMENRDLTIKNINFLKQIVTLKSLQFNDVNFDVDFNMMTKGVLNQLQILGFNDCQIYIHVIQKAIKQSKSLKQFSLIGSKRLQPVNRLLKIMPKLQKLLVQFNNQQNTQSIFNKNNPSLEQQITKFQQKLLTLRINGYQCKNIKLFEDMIKSLNNLEQLQLLCQRQYNYHQYLQKGSTITKQMIQTIVNYSSLTILNLQGKLSCEVIYEIGQRLTNLKILKLFSVETNYQPSKYITVSKLNKLLSLFVHDSSFHDSSKFKILFNLKNIRNTQSSKLWRHCTNTKNQRNMNLINPVKLIQS